MPIEAKDLRDKPTIFDQAEGKSIPEAALIFMRTVADHLTGKSALPTGGGPPEEVASEKEHGPQFTEDEPYVDLP